MSTRIRNACLSQWLCGILFVWALAALGLAIAQPADEAPAQATATPTGEYLIGPDDQLQIFVWRQPELSVTVPVRPDGRISTPLVEDIVAVNKTPTQLADEIETALSVYVRSPEVNVMVLEFVGVLGAQVRVLGQVAEPRTVAYRNQMTLLDVLDAVGGLTEFAAGNRARIVRTVDGKSEEIRVRLKDLLERGEIEENRLVQPGDMLIVPEAVF